MTTNLMCQCLCRHCRSEPAAAHLPGLSGTGQWLTASCSLQIYELYGVLVHQGHSMHSGHYYCFVKAPNGVWNKMDDSTVGQARSRSVHRMDTMASRRPLL